MTYVLIGSAALVGLLVLYQFVRKVPLNRLARSLRWVAGGGAALLTAFLLLRGQAGVASVTGFLAYSVLRWGRLGPIDLNGVGRMGEEDADGDSEVRSRYFAMRLDHASGAVSGRVIAGRLAGADLMDVGEADTRELLAEVAGDPDSLALLETWLDRNRAGWREYFAEQDAASAEQEQSDPDAEAYAVLGLQPGATADEIRAAHRTLMKGVHPDQGGSTYLAAKINEAKDRLLRKHAGQS